jgi:hypothetical protein
MSKVLIIWEVIPDNVEPYSVDTTSESYPLAIKMAGLYLGVTVLEEQEEDLLKLHDLLKKEGEKHDEDNEIKGPFESVIICGQVL